MLTTDLYTFKQENIIIPWGVDWNQTIQTTLGNISTWTTQLKAVDPITGDVRLYLNQAGGAGTHGSIVPNSTGLLTISVDAANLRFRHGPYNYGIVLENAGNKIGWQGGILVLKEFPV